MIKCLNCEKEIEPKRASRKYCSDSCRVLYHRKHGKKEAVSKFQMQVLYNEVLAMVKDLNKPTNEIKPFQQPTTTFTINTIPQKTTKSFTQYLNEKREILTEEQFEGWLKEVENDPLLTSRQKLTLKTIL